MSTEKMTMLIISGIVVLGFGGVLLAWMWAPHAADDKVIPLLIGALTAGYLQVINYWFSKAKD